MSENNLVEKLHDNLFDFENDLSTERALELCSGHLQGSWSEASLKDISVNVIRGGFVNRLFLIQNNKTNDKVLIRLYGGKFLPQDNQLRSIGYEGEVLVFQLMAEKSIGPKLLGVFDGGRLEEYREGCRTPLKEDINDLQTMASLAKQLARLHSCRLPFNKQPKDYIKLTRDNFEKGWTQYKDFVQSIPFPLDRPHVNYQERLDSVLSFDYKETLEWLEKEMKVIPSKVVFSHNDMNIMNCLIDPNKSGDEKAILLDFELCGYNFRGADIGCHFGNRRFDLEGVIKQGNSFEDVFLLRSPHPSEENRRHFIEAYLLEVKKSMDNNNEMDPKIDHMDHILMEAELYGALYSLFMLSYMVNSNEFKEMAFSMGHPVVMVSTMMEGVTEKKDILKDLKKRLM